MRRSTAVRVELEEVLRLHDRGPDLAGGDRRLSGSVGRRGWLLAGHALVVGRVALVLVLEAHQVAELVWDRARRAGVSHVVLAGVGPPAARVDGDVVHARSLDGLELDPALLRAVGLVHGGVVVPRRGHVPEPCGHGHRHTRIRHEVDLDGHVDGIARDLVVKRTGDDVLPAADLLVAADRHVARPGAEPGLRELAPATLQRSQSADGPRRHGELVTEGLPDPPDGAGRAGLERGRLEHDRDQGQPLGVATRRAKSLTAPTAAGVRSANARRSCACGSSGTPPDGAAPASDGPALDRGAPVVGAPPRARPRRGRRAGRRAGGAPRRRGCRRATGGRERRPGRGPGRSADGRRRAPRRHMALSPAGARADAGGRAVRAPRPCWSWARCAPVHLQRQHRRAARPR